MPKLTYSVGGEERTVEVGASCSIGRDEGNTIVLDPSTGASRRHCQIIKLQSTYELADLGSTNGTNVNGERVKRHKLRHGDRIKIGEAVLNWTDPDSAGDDDEVNLEEEISLEEPSSGGKASGAAGENCFLVFAGGGKDGDKLKLEKSRVTFGRKSSNTVVLDDNAVSGYHCEVSREGGAYVLRDLGSTNGTLLDGEPVTEVVLQHGGRLRVGAQQLVFVDPSVADFEKAMSAVEDLGSEWGLLRAEMDMDRVQKARRSQAVAIVGTLAVVGVIGWVVVSNPELFSKQEAKLEVVDNNKVPDFSFEAGADGWAAVAGSPALGSSVRDDANQGTRSYKVSRDGAEGPLAVVSNTANPAFEIAVRPSLAYEFGASVKASGGAQAAVRLNWTRSGDDGVQHSSSTGLSDASAWKQVRSVAVSPADVSSVRVELLNAGPGSAFFDDLFLVEASGGGDAATISSGDLELTAGDDGLVAIQRAGQMVLDGLAVVSGAFPADAERLDRRGPRSGGTTGVSVSSVDGAVELSGKVYNGAKGEYGDFKVLIAASGTQILITGTLPAEAGLVASLPKVFVENSVGVFTKSGRSFRLAETRIAPDVTSVEIGNLKRFRVSGSEEGGDFQVGLFAVGNGWELALAGKEGPVALVLETDSRMLIDEVRKLKGLAQDAEAQKRFGLAITRYRELMGRLTQGSSEAQAASDKADEIAADGAERLQRLKRSVSDALAFGSSPDLLAATSEAAAMVTAYDGNTVGTEASVERKRADEGLKTLLKAARQELAAPVLARAQDFLKAGENELGKAFLTDVTIRFAGTEAAKEAEKMLAQVGGKDAP